MSRNVLRAAALLVLGGAAALAAAQEGDQPRYERGARLFAKYCVLCHGEKGHGDGQAALLYQPRPANLTVSPYPDSYREKIIRGGGTAVGRSASMPPWGRELSDADIAAVLVYLRRIGTEAKR